MPREIGGTIQVEFRRNGRRVRPKPDQLTHCTSSSSWSPDRPPPQQKADYLRRRDGDTAAREYAYARMQDHEQGTESNIYWHKVWQLLRPIGRFTRTV